MEVDHFAVGGNTVCHMPGGQRQQPISQILQLAHRGDATPASRGYHQTTNLHADSMNMINNTR